MNRMVVHMLSITEVFQPLFLQPICTNNMAATNIGLRMQAK